MKAVVLSAFGPATEVLSLEDRPLPQPGPGEVRVRLLLSPVHNHDLMIIEGKYGIRPPLPHVPGTEAVGVVEALGEGVTHLSVGQRVAGGASAAWAEAYVAPAQSLVPVPDEIDDATASQLVAMPISAYRLLHDLRLQPGDWIVQNAANGLVGKLVAKLAVERGVRVLNLVRRQSAVAELAAEGIGDAVATDSPDWKAQAQAITGGASIRRAIDSLAGRAANDLMDLLGDEGWLISFGALSGEPLSLDASNILFKRATIKGFWAAKPSTTMTPEEIRAGLIDLVRRARDGSLKLSLAEIYPLAEHKAAMEASARIGRGAKIAFRGA